MYSIRRNAACLDNAEEVRQKHGDRRISFRIFFCPHSPVDKRVLIAQVTVFGQNTVAVESVALAHIQFARSAARLSNQKEDFAAGDAVSDGRTLLPATLACINEVHLHVLEQRRVRDLLRRCVLAGLPEWDGAAVGVAEAEVVGFHERNNTSSHYRCRHPVSLTKYFQKRLQCLTEPIWLHLLPAITSLQCPAPIPRVLTRSPWSKCCPKRG